MLHLLVENIRAYVNGRISLSTLEAWLVSNLQHIMDSGDRVAIELANELDADLMEVGEGLLDEDTLSERVQQYLGQETISIILPASRPSAVQLSGSGAKTVTWWVEDRSVVDLHLAHQFG